MQVLTDGGAMQVTLHLLPNGKPEPPKPEGHVAYAADSGSLVFVGTHLAPLEDYKTYELWVLPSDGGPALPAGIFKPDPARVCQPHHAPDAQGHRRQRLRRHHRTRRRSQIPDPAHRPRHVTGFHHHANGPPNQGGPSCICRCFLHLLRIQTRDLSTGIIGLQVSSE